LPGTSLNSKSTDRLRDLMASAGFAVNEDTGELADHISVELSFMAELARQEAGAWQAGEADEAGRIAGVQRRLMHDHLGRWAESFAGQARCKAATGFYRAMADLLDDFINAERNILGQQHGESGH
jgi:TorA maturation chaperone TorD